MPTWLQIAVNEACIVQGLYSFHKVTEHLGHVSARTTRQDRWYTCALQALSLQCDGTSHRSDRPPGAFTIRSNSSPPSASGMTTYTERRIRLMKASRIGMSPTCATSSVILRAKATSRQTSSRSAPQLARVRVTFAAAAGTTGQAQHTWDTPIVDHLHGHGIAG